MPGLHSRQGHSSRILASSKQNEVRANVDIHTLVRELRDNVDRGKSRDSRTVRILIIIMQELLLPCWLHVKSVLHLSLHISNSETMIIFEKSMWHLLVTLRAHRCVCLFSFLVVLNGAPPPEIFNKNSHPDVEKSYQRSSAEPTRAPEPKPRQK